MQHSSDKLTEALRRGGLESLARKAATHYYHDFLSPLDFPCLQLNYDLSIIATDATNPHQAAAKALLKRHVAGEFDATADESREWAESDDGKATLELLMPHSGRR